MVSRERSHIIAVIALIGFVAIIVAVYVAYTSPTGIKARLTSDIHTLDTDTEAAYTDIHGEKIELGEDTDAPLVINVWATWSPYTPTEFEVLEKLKKKYGDTIHIIALNRMEPKETAQAYLGTLRSYEGIEFILDTNDHFFKTVGGYAMPETIVYNKVGNATFHKRGTLNESEVTIAIEEALKI